MSQMLVALHFDGVVLFVASLLLAMLGQSYHRWRFRVPMFVLAFCFFALSIKLMGLMRPTFGLPWFWLRLVGDSMTLTLAAIYFGARRGHHQHTKTSDHAMEATMGTRK